MNTPSNEPVTLEHRGFESVEEAIAFLRSITQTDTIIIITPPPH